MALLNIVCIKKFTVKAGSARLRRSSWLQNSRRWVFYFISIFFNIERRYRHEVYFNIQSIMVCVMHGPVVGGSCERPSGRMAERAGLLSRLPSPLLSPGRAPRPCSPNIRLTEGHHLPIRSPSHQAQSWPRYSTETRLGLRASSRITLPQKGL